MGVDATIFVVADFSDETGYLTATFRLKRDSDFWDILEAIEADRTWAQIQLPQGSWAGFSIRGEEHGAAIPDAFKEWERGYLRADNYGNKLQSFKGRELASLESDYSDFNTAVMAFVGEHYADHDVIIFWS